MAPATVEALAIGAHLADRLRPATGYELPVDPIAGPPASGHIYLTLLDGDASLGDEGYTLRCGAGGLTVAAYRPAGLFWGAQTVRQLLPAGDRIRSGPGRPVVAAGSRRCAICPASPGAGRCWTSCRHFFSVDDVKRYIDLLAYYKVNRFHLHLTEDQGWRIEIKTWPKLAEIGGSTQVGGGPGGYYTQEEYAEIVRYAQSRYIMVVPEIDMPGHYDGGAGGLSRAEPGRHHALAVHRDRRRHEQPEHA